MSKAPSSADEAREAAKARRYQRATAMRTRQTAERRTAVPLSGGTLPPLGVIALNRLAFGPAPGDLESFEALGATDDDRLVAFVDQQLDPNSISDTAADAKIAASGYSTVDKTKWQLWAQHVVPDLEWEDRIRPMVESTFQTVLKAVHSRRQLFEVITEFWHNHFSIFGWGFYEAPMWVNYDRDVIRANALGNFRTLLGAVARSNSMLIYLDNYLNSEEGPNENYARELMELHTLGDESYYGTIPREQVPLDGDGYQVGFVDEDVFAVAKALTGWSIDADPWWDLESGHGGYTFRDDWHEKSEKNVLGHTLAAGRGQQDGDDVLDILATHSGTAHFVCRKLCRRLIGDFPSEAVVEAAAATFLANTEANDQIKQVIRTIVLSDDFKTTWGAKIKRPFEIISGALRATNSDFPFIEGDDESESFDWQFYLTGHYLFSWHPPNGYPDFGEAWVSSGPRVMTWRLTNWLMDFDWDVDRFRIDTFAETPAGVRSATEITDHWIDRILGRTISEVDRQELIDFMAQGHNPDFDLPLDTDDDTRSRLQSLVGLIFMSPEFMWR